MIIQRIEDCYWWICFIPNQNNSTGPQIWQLDFLFIYLFIIFLQFGISETSCSTILISYLNICVHYLLVILCSFPYYSKQRPFILVFISVSYSIPFVGRHSDLNLVELNGTVKEDDRAVLLEGGVLQSVSPKTRSSSVTSQIFRFLNDY